MKKQKKVPSKTSFLYKFLYWAPRILTIVYIIFISSFALDVFQPNYSMRENIGGLCMHLMPSLALLIIFVIGRKYELRGAVLFVCVGGIYRIKMQNFPLITHLIITGPIFLIALCFLLHWILGKRKHWF